MVLRKLIFSKLYVLIYTELKAKFISREWNGTELDTGKKFEVWGKLDPDGELAVYRLFGVRQKFFYERNSWAESEEDISLKVELLDDVLQYLDCIGSDTKALLSSFFVRYKVPNDIISAQENLRKEETSEIEAETNYAITSNEQHITANTINHKTVNNINIYATPSGNSDDVSRVVHLFYEHISKGSHSSYESAWTLLSDSFKERIWEKSARLSVPSKTGLDLFKDGYYFFRSLKKTHVFNVEIDQSTADCMVYYEENLELPHIEELAEISKTSIKNAKSLVDKLESLAKVVEEFGGKGFGNKALMRLFYPTPTETIWFEHGMDQVAFKDAYPNTTHTAVSRLLKCRCVKETDTWFIDGLVPLHCRHI